MQIDKREYNPDLHEVFRCLTVKQPYADLLTRVIFRDELGEYHASKEIEVRSRNTSYRGELLICSSAKPVDPWGRHPSGVTCGLVELYDVKRVEDFDEIDWVATCIPKDQRPTTGYGWLMRNPRRVVEMPIRGQLGVYSLIVPKGDITVYPRDMALGDDGWEIIKKKINR